MHLKPLIKSIFTVTSIALAFSVYGANVRFQKIVDTNTPIPQGKGDFIRFSGPYLMGGKVVFRGFGHGGQVGVYSNLYGQLRMIANTKTPIPSGHGNFEKFGVFVNPKAFNPRAYEAFNSPSLGQKVVAFMGGGDDGQDGVYVYEAKGDQSGDLIKIADRNTKIPGGHGTFTVFHGPYVSGGNIAFRALGPDEQQGLYTTQGSFDKLTMIYNTNTPIPGGQGTFKRLWNPSFSQGDVAFSNGGPSHPYGGMYANVSGKLAVIANAHTHLPGSKSFFTSIGGASLQGKGIAFRGAGKMHYGIYYYYDGKLNKAVDNNTPIPQGVGDFVDMDNPTYNNGLIAFSGEGKYGQRGIYVFEHGRVIKVVSIADKIDGKAISRVSLGPYSINGHTVAIDVVFKEGSRGLYYAYFR